MPDALTQLVLAKKLDYADGQIRLFDQPILQVPPLFYPEILRELRKQKKEDLLYTAHLKAGQKWFQRTAAQTNKTQPDDLLDLLVKLLNLSALGQIKTIKKDFDAVSFQFSLDNSLVASAYGRSPMPVDLPLAGLLAGGIQAICNAPVQCHEVQCQACGKPNCLFTVEAL